MLNKQYLIAVAAGGLLTLALGAGALTFAQIPDGSTTSPSGNPPTGVAGTVSAVSGNTVTLTGKDGKTYTLDATSATVTKDETVAISDIKVGDTLVAQGSVNGTSVTATNIHDGQLLAGGFGGMRGGPGKMGMGVRGSVTAISGNTLTVTSTNPKDNTTSVYNVDATNAQVLVGSGTGKPTTGSFSSMKVGDTVMVAGAVSGQNVTAKTIFDGPMPSMHWGAKSNATTTTASQ